MGRARLMTTPIHHTTGYYTLSSLFLPPLDLQKGERDTQSRLEQTGLLRLAAQWYPSRRTASSGRSVPPVCGDSAMVPYTVRLRPHYLHNLVWHLPFTVELPSSWRRKPHAVALLATLLRLQVVPRQRVHNVDTLSGLADGFAPRRVPDLNIQRQPRLSTKHGDRRSHSRTLVNAAVVRQHDEWQHVITLA
ncbi:hypothetical protein T05_1825 [Trichinella murrelli]|uniref:Uncharacterized protein n=1 Tax=Trichinella murrelli TaxID=144512 RepID=A0A0V0TCI1_9BILA|nr:hypothetical protein T05_1825 [Trichinella murrelli]